LKLGAAIVVVIQVVHLLDEFSGVWQWLILLAISIVVQV
jgi:low affinity Fe/Cu permease